MWKPINLKRHMFLDNPSVELANLLNSMRVTKFILLQDNNDNIDGVGWVPNE